MKGLGVANIAVALILLAVPLVALYVTAQQGNVSGIGFKILLYEPFDFAYVLLAWTLFFVVNFQGLAIRTGIRWQTLSSAVATSGILVIGWFFVTFFAVFLLHTSLGGSM